MRIFLKAQTSSLLATIIDFGLLILFTEIIGLRNSFSIVVGAIGGAVTNFTINRFWSFKAVDKSFFPQSIKYLIIWVVSISLNVTGVLLLTEKLNVQYITSKVIVSTIVGLTFNYFLQKKFIFNKND